MLKAYSSSGLEDLLTWAQNSAFAWHRGNGTLKECSTIDSRLSPAGVAPILPRDELRPSSTDFPSAVLIHEWLGNLNEAQASDRRLWTWLTHNQFPQYVRQRWPSGKASDESIRSHWFVSGHGLAALRRNAVARLWWACHVSSDPVRWAPDWAAIYSPSDKYEYTALLTGNQDVYQALMERSFGSDRRILFAVLELLRRVDEGRRAELAKATAKEINLVLRYRDLAVLPAAALMDEVGGLAERVASTATPE